MAQFIYTMNRVSKVVPPKRIILRDISLSFFPGAKIGVLGLNGSGKSTLLRIMAGADQEIEGEARPQPGIKIGMLSQEPQLDPQKDVRGNVVERDLHRVEAQLRQMAEVALRRGPCDVELRCFDTNAFELMTGILDAHVLRVHREAERGRRFVGTSEFLPQAVDGPHVLVERPLAVLYRGQ